MSKKIIIAGGGTGGHIFPAIAIANALKAMDNTIEFLFIGAKGKMEMEKVPKAGYAIKGLTIAGFNRASLLKNITLPFKLIQSFFEVSTIFKSFRPNAVIGVGGYSSFPVLRYAQSKNIPTFIHESNSFAGRSNIMLGKKATKIFVAVDGMEKFFPKEKILVSGNPVRQSIAHATVNKQQALMAFGLLPDLKTILIVGGSLGAKSINEVIQNNLPVFANHQIQLIWQTGKTNAEAYQQAAANFRNVSVNVFIDNMEMAYVAADVVISRSGAMAVTELCVLNKAVVFVPYPHAAEDQQTANALYLVNKQAALIVKDIEVKNELISTSLELVKSEQKQNELKQNIAALAKTDADIFIAKEILKILA